MIDTRTPAPVAANRRALLLVVPTLILVAAVAVLPAVAVGQSAAPATATSPSDGDALDEALALVDLTRSDLGWRPKAWWPKFPADIPYKLRSFDALFAEPLDTIVYARTLAHAAKEHLAAETISDKLDRDTTHLFNAVHQLGIDPKYGGLRGYTANLTAAPTPLADALLAVYAREHRTTEPYTFAMELPYPRIAEDLRVDVEGVPEAVQPIVGQLIMNLIEARRWADLAFRRVPMADRLVVSRRFNLGAEQVDAWDYCPQIDDVALAWDQASLWYASEQCVQALDLARIELAALEYVPAFAFDAPTPWGWVRLRGTGNDEVDGQDTWLIIDMGGDDSYTGPVAAGTAVQPIGLLLDLGGDDRYQSDQPAQGAGVTGIGVLIDAGGDDHYDAVHYAQGVGQFGFGLCADLGGDDEYAVRYSGQGCGYFGVGLLCDCAGDDRYRLYADGQGLGGVSGVGVLADRAGDDVYHAERDATLTGRPSYHSPDQNITVSNAQGCAMGRRGDGADGHSYAGGLGALLDSEGNDQYVSGNWAMGTGYWFGTGILHDGAGDDTYRGVCYTQATGAHFCIGALIDEAGDDQHLGEVTSNMCAAWGHDFTIALLLNVGGDDVYSLKGNGLSYGINRSVTALIDTAGADRYTGKVGNHPGQAVYAERFERSEISNYFAEATSLSLFLDVGGSDTYASHPADDATGGEPGSDAPYGGSNNSTWLAEPGSDNARAHNFGVGVDRANGEVHFYPRREKK